MLISSQNVLTIDVEDWCQSTFDHSSQITENVRHNTIRMLEILAENNTKATFFVLGLVADRFPELVKRIYAEGHEVATHGYSHKLIFEQSREEFTQDLKKSIKSIENIIDDKVLGYRAPDFSITEKSLWALDVMEQEGLKYDSSIFPIKHPRYGICDTPRQPHFVNGKDGLIELPLSTVKMCGINIPACGGGYMRLLPYEATRWAIRKINQEGMSAIIYLHPYELDPDEFKRLKVKIPLKLRISQGTHRSKTEYKLKRLLNDFKFTTISETLNYER